ncbi:MAG TPA: hypothetical protein VGR65_05270 [Casimicrobiaceae bacterium]|jgi:LysR family tcuABC transcriptional regulator|nr:hypothetical protein [Casimicrobiaceae bacterium]
MYSLSINLEEAAALPLILPTPAHGLRRRISIELEQRNLSANVVAEIDTIGIFLYDRFWPFSDHPV